MGDTGSLAIGSGLAAICLLMNLDLLLPILGGLFVFETVSVIAQVISFRVFGKRIFRMAPFHHHFELLGWPETTVIVRFWILGGLFAARKIAQPRASPHDPKEDPSHSLRDPSGPGHPPHHPARRNARPRHRAASPPPP